jgi:serine/threonine protein kinase
MASDIKPDNVLVGCGQDGQGPVIEDVQLIDLENAAYLPKGRCIKGMLAGNDDWRSPEAHFKGELNKPTDIFSFGIVVRPQLLLLLLVTDNIISASMLYLDA